MLNEQDKILYISYQLCLYVNVYVYVYQGGRKQEEGWKREKGNGR